MATTSPNNISYPTNADAQKTIEQRIQDTASSVQTALNTKADLSGAAFTGGVTSSYISGIPHFASTNSSSASDQYNYVLGAANDTGSKVTHFLNSSTRTTDGGANGYTIRNDGGPLNLGHSSYTTTISGDRILAPNQPYFFIKGQETNYTLTNGADVPFNTAIYNRGSHFNTSNYRFTAPVAGVYQISISFFCNGGSGRMSMKVNGGAYNNMQTQWNSTGNWSYSAAIYLNANDYVTVGDWQSLSGATPYMGHSNFSGYLLG